jgi:hypothetical protein
MAMTGDKGKTESAGSCDIRVWCDACKQTDYKTEGDKYLCASCGKIMGLDHEVRHEGFPHISGDDDNLY